MTMLALISFLSGAMLGRRHVLVLVPAIAAALLVVYPVAWMAEMSGGSALIACALVAVGLQVGYAAAVIGEFLLATLRAARARQGAAALARRW